MIARQRCGLIPIAIATFVLIAAAPAPATAQQSLGDVLSFLLTNRSIPTGDFVQDEQVAAATRDTISGALLAGLATLPVSSSASGFTYRLDRALGGVAVRSSDSFGPFFTERSLTAGRYSGSFGVSYQHISFDTIDGHDLRDGTLLATASTLGRDPTPFDVETLSLRLQTDSLTLSGNYGLSDRVDVGAVLPLVRLTLRGERIDTYRGSQLLQAAASSTASGVGDLVVRVKYNVVRSSGTGLAVGAETRLPTCNEENLLGAGEASVKPRLVWSLERGRVAVDSDIGYSFGGLSDEVTYGGAVTVVGSPRLMLIGEIAGRRLGSTGQLAYTTAPHPRLTGVETIRLSSLEEASHRVITIVGVKWNPGGTWLVAANVLRRVTTAGLTARWVPTVALEYSFSR